MNGNFTPLTRCPGHDGAGCQALIDASSARTCGSCRGLVRKAASKPSSQDARASKIARERFPDADPPKASGSASLAPAFGVTPSQNTPTKGGQQ